MDNSFIAMTKLLEEGQKVILARIIRQVGSAPRSTGTSCLIMEGGSITGTIGGGLLEFQVMEKAEESLKTGKSSLHHFQLTGEEVAQTEMLCGGIVDVYLEPFFPGNTAVNQVIREIKNLILENRKGTLLTRVAEGIDHADEACRCLIMDNGVTIGSIATISEEPEQKLSAWGEVRKPGLKELKKEGELIFVEPIEPDNVLYLFGGGHISTFLVPLARMADFRVVVIDDREEFANRQRFPNADELMVLPFAEMFDRISITPASYVAIITRGHIHDRDVLREALRSDAAYIGMIGSRRKRNTIYASLIDEGVTREELEQVHSPIGLDIGAETPEEIAISIVAELVQMRAGKPRIKALTQ